MYPSRILRAGSALKIVAALLFAVIGSSAHATPVLYTFTGVILGNSDPVNPAGTIEAFTYLSSAGFITSTQGVPLAELSSCTGCSSDYSQAPAAPGDYPVTFLPAFGGYDYIEFLDDNSITLSADFYYFGLGAFSGTGTYVNGGTEASGTLTVAAVPEPSATFLIGVPLIVVVFRHWRRRGFTTIGQLF